VTSFLSAHGPLHFSKSIVGPKPDSKHSFTRGVLAPQWRADNLDSQPSFGPKDGSAVNRPDLQALPSSLRC
jgi:hypothetical protein